MSSLFYSMQSSRSFILMVQVQQTIGSVFLYCLTDFLLENNTEWVELAVDFDLSKYYLMFCFLVSSRNV